MKMLYLAVPIIDGQAVDYAEFTLTDGGFFEDGVNGTIVSYGGVVLLGTDGDDVFPNDAAETTDGDGVGDNAYRLSLRFCKCTGTERDMAVVEHARRLLLPLGEKTELI